MEDMPAQEGGSLPVKNLFEQSPSQVSELTEKIEEIYPSEKPAGGKPEAEMPTEKAEVPLTLPEIPKTETRSVQAQAEPIKAAQEAISVVRETAKELSGQQPVGAEQVLDRPPPKMIRTWPSTVTALKIANERQAELARVAALREKKLPKKL